jgi:hypothetical protein
VRRAFQDDLPSVSISRLRATGVITAETTTFLVQLGDVEQTVGVTERRFPNGGGWSQFVCPSCGWKVRMLRLLEGAVLCTRCCVRRGVRRHCESMSPRQRAEHRIPKLRAMLESPVPLRLKPILWGTMERRKRLEARLREAEFRAAQVRSPRKKGAAIVDPCEEPDFKPPKRPWPRLKSKLSESG